MRNELIEVVLKSASLDEVWTLDRAREEKQAISVAFKTSADRDAFVRACPKYLRVRSYECRGFDKGDVCGLVVTDCAVPFAGIYIAPTKLRFLGTSKVTGEVNETGDKRLKKWFEVIAENCSIKHSFYPQF